jgi:hypothetical protein
MTPVQWNREKRVVEMKTDPLVRKILTQFRLVQNRAHSKMSREQTRGLVGQLGRVQSRLAAPLMHAGGKFPNWMRP